MAVKTKEQCGQDFKSKEFFSKKLNMLKNANGGSIWDAMDKVPVTRTPTLVVAIGGMACKTLNQVKREYCMKIVETGANKHVDFLAIDTCEQDLGKLMKNDADPESIGCLEESDVYSLTRHMNPATAHIVAAVKNPANATPQRAWMDMNLPDSLVISNNGAQGIRQVGRLILSDRNVYDTLLNKIREKMRSLSKDVSNISVLVIAGVSSGTGSGTIVDIAYMLHLAALEIGGFTMVPEAIIYAPIYDAGDPAVVGAWDNLQRNFISAMKEIDAYMEASDSKEKYRFECDKFPDGIVQDIAGRSIDSLNIFDSCTIMQGYSDGGVAINRSMVMDSTVCYIVSMISDITVMQGGNHVPMAESVLSNERIYSAMNSGAVLNSKPTLPRDARYKYRTMGYHSVEFPVQELMTILANHTLIALEKEFDKEPNQNAIDILKKAKVILDNANLDISSTSTDHHIWYDGLFNAEKNEQTLQQIKSLSADMNYRDARNISIREHDNELAHIAFDKSWVASMANSIDAYLTQEIKKGNGPFAAQRLSGYILDQLRKMITEFAFVKRDFDAYFARCESAAQNAKNEVDNAGLFSLFGRGEIIETFARTMAVRDVWRWKLMVLTDAYEALNELHTIVLNRNNERYERYVGAFVSICEVVGEDSSSSIKASQSKRADGGAVFSSGLNMSDLDDHAPAGRLKELMQYYVGNGDASKARIANLSKKLIDSMLNNVDTWTGTDGFDGPEEMRMLFKEQFSTFKQNTLLKIMIAYYTGVSVGGANVSVSQICDMMDDPKYNLNSNAPNWTQFNDDCGMNYAIKPLDVAAAQISNELMAITSCGTPEGYGFSSFASGGFYVYDVICLMQHAGPINQLIDANIRTANPSINIGDGSAPRYMRMQIFTGLPLYLFKGMTESQKTYTNYVHKTNPSFAGMHMSNDSENPWCEFPPIVNNTALAALNQPNFNREQSYLDEQEILNRVKKQTELCDLNGFLRMQVGGYYQLQFVDDEDILAYPKTDEQKQEMEDKLRQKPEYAQVLNLYRQNIQASVASAQKKMNPYAIDLLQEWEKAFQSSMPSNTMYDLMALAGYGFSQRDIRNVYPYVLINNVTDKGDDTQYGEMYKLIRFSSETRRCVAHCAVLVELLQAEFAKILDEETADAKKKIVDAMQQKKEEEKMRLLLKAMITEHVIVTLDPDYNGVKIELYEDLTKPPVATPVFRTQRLYEYDYALYSIFAGWFNGYKNDDTNWWNYFTGLVNGDFANFGNQQKAEKWEKWIVPFIKTFPENYRERLTKVQSLSTLYNQYLPVDSAYFNLKNAQETNPTNPEELNPLTKLAMGMDDVHAEETPDLVRHLIAFYDAIGNAKSILGC